ncbi:hypothetical protein VSS37_07300 [Candidatus Thiothrix sp. Deng01]|uniref:Uncharacterized protein n=1 Tax=Candidatus Thiothrix phosphatis TaxID=3112415 RepID=A0ABU6CVF5_9GAMM|nr:hypothetical protein [Candidatus Thiothrix sp. Deng01]MEB4590780.1 hypothetical protein [Candidatus Thiothrix sp. Deng01]
MNQSATFTRGELSGSFDTIRLQVVEVQSLLDAIQRQHDNSPAADQLSGIIRLLNLLDSELGRLQTRADDLEAWAHVTAKRAAASLASQLAEVQS